MLTEDFKLAAGERVATSFQRARCKLRRTEYCERLREPLGSLQLVSARSILESQCFVRIQSAVKHHRNGNTIFARNIILSYINTLFESIAADNKTQGMVESMVLSQA